MRLGVGHAVPLAALETVLVDADVVISSTGASHFVLTPEIVTRAMAARGGRPMFIIDIAVPRDVDPAIGRIPGVRVADIDQLAATVDVTLERRREAIPLVEAIVDEHLTRYHQWADARDVLPVIASLSKKAETIREAEIGRVFARCPALTERDRVLIRGMSLTIVSKLLHSAMSRIREKALGDHVEALEHARVLRELFELGELAGQAVMADEAVETAAESAEAVLVERRSMEHFAGLD
jgi:glutamyl-tRNA reductase